MDEDELRRRFDALISGRDLADLRDLAAGLGMLGAGAGHADPPALPSLRRPPREQPVVYGLRVELVGDEPEIWRRLRVRSDITLAEMHDILQAAFAWSDTHLHRFSIGGEAWERGSENFLCPFDVDEGDDDGMPASEVRLDETLHDLGDVLHYVYDYGDNWRVRVRLEEATDAATADTPVAVCVDGRRAAPPEDSRGVDDETLRELLPDPERFSVDEVNQALQDPFIALRQLGLGDPLVDVLTRLRGTEAEGETLLAAMTLIPGDPVDPDERHEALRAYRWFLERASAGLALTPAGYLKPADVVQACAAVPATAAWIGARNRESNIAPLGDFRMLLTTYGLLRKYRGELLLTQAGARARRSDDRLWEHLVTRVHDGITGVRPLRTRDGNGNESFSRDATVLVLLAAAAPARGGRHVLEVDRVAGWLTALGWQRADGTGVRGYDLYRENVFVVLDNIARAPRDWRDRSAVDPVAAAFAGSVLRGAGEVTPAPAAG
ncbi:plasmid pRiA4b ORF-3 family protein [Microbacterium aureliae]